MTKNILFLLLSLSILSAGCGLQKGSSFQISTESSITAEFEKTQESEETMIVAYVCGAVKNPGVYSLKESCRIKDLIEAAGGAKENADLSKINLAQRLADGQQVIVPENGTSSNGQESSGSGKVNINFADKEELMTLPGIGEAKAEAILAYREEIGWFQSTEELMNVSGIKEKMYARIADRIEV